MPDLDVVVERTYWPADALLEIPSLQRLLLSDKTEAIWYCLRHETWVVSLVNPTIHLTLDLLGQPVAPTCWGHITGYCNIFFRSTEFGPRIYNWGRPNAQTLALIVENVKRQESKT